MKAIDQTWITKGAKYLDYYFDRLALLSPDPAYFCAW